MQMWTRFFRALLDISQNCSITSGFREILTYKCKKHGFLLYSGLNYIPNFFSKNSLRNLKVPFLPFKTLSEFIRYLFFSSRYRSMKLSILPFSWIQPYPKKFRPESRRNNALLFSSVAKSKSNLRIASSPQVF